MAEIYYSILTNIGKAQMANALGLGTTVDFVKMKVGDGNGSYYNPTESQLDLVHTVWEGSIGHVAIDEENPNWINIEVLIPPDVGGFMIREYGIFDANNNMLGIAKCPETYKPLPADGSTKELNMKFVLAVTNTSSVTLKIDPTILFAKKKDVDVVQNQVNTIATEIQNARGAFQNLKARLDDSDSSLSDMDYQTAGGTATAITLTMQTLRNGYAKNFIAKLDNGGVATDINTIPVYKPGTTTTPTIKANKPYTVIYNEASTCFFLKASAEGDALQSHVLATKKFSNDDDTGLIGLMPNNGAITNTIASAGGTYTIPAGYHNGSGVVTAPSLAAVTANGTVTSGAQMLLGYKAVSNGVLYTGTIASKTAATYNPSTVAQTIATGQYLSGIQTISATTGTANPVDVVAGKTFNSASGIGQIGTATIASLGGKQYASGTATTTSSSLTFTDINGTSYSRYYLTVTGLSFKPSIITIFDIAAGPSYSTYYTDESAISTAYPTTYSGYNKTVIATQSGSRYAFKGDVLPAKSDYGTFTMPMALGSRSVAWYAWG